MICPMCDLPDAPQDHTCEGFREDGTPVVFTRSTFANWNSNVPTGGVAKPLTLSLLEEWQNDVLYSNYPGEGRLRCPDGDRPPIWKETFRQYNGYQLVSEWAFYPSETLTREHERCLLRDDDHPHGFVIFTGGEREVCL